MENQRLLVWATFGMLLWLTYQSWTQDYGPQPADTNQPTVDESLQPPSGADSLPALPAAAADSTVDAPQIQDPTTTPQAAPEADAADDSELDQLPLASANSDEAAEIPAHLLNES